MLIFQLVGIRYRFYLDFKLGLEFRLFGLLWNFLRIIGLLLNLLMTGFLRLWISVLISCFIDVIILINRLIVFIFKWKGFDNNLGLISFFECLKLKKFIGMSLKFELNLLLFLILNLVKPALIEIRGLE